MKCQEPWNPGQNSERLPGNSYRVVPFSTPVSHGLFSSVYTRCVQCTLQYKQLIFHGSQFTYRHWDISNTALILLPPPPGWGEAAGRVGIDGHQNMNGISVKRNVIQNSHPLKRSSERYKALHDSINKKTITQVYAIYCFNGYCAHL